MKLPKSFRPGAIVAPRPSTLCKHCDKQIGMVRFKGSGIKRCFSCGKIQ